VPLTAAECPANLLNTAVIDATFPNCAGALAIGAVCEGDGQRGTNVGLDNCASADQAVGGGWDFYKRVACHNGAATAVPDGIADCLPTQDAARILDNPLITYAELDAIRKSCPVSCGECAKKHFYYPASLMNEVRLHCPKACSSSSSGTPFCHT